MAAGAGLERSEDIALILGALAVYRRRRESPPFVGFSESGPFAQGPRRVITKFETMVKQMLPLTVRMADDAKEHPFRRG